MHFSGVKLGRGMVLFHRGENLDSLADIRKFISYAENNRYQELLTLDLYLKEGCLLSESLSYDEAIIALTKAIEHDPKNVDAYFERAIAYFETGDFSKALSDYLASHGGRFTMQRTECTSYPLCPDNR
jgi:tetratricopeptide (TPR) repeat protein